MLSNNIGSYHIFQYNRFFLLYNKMPILDGLHHVEFTFASEKLQLRNYKGNELLL